jgi:hypothetical protein
VGELDGFFEDHGGPLGYLCWVSFVFPARLVFRTGRWCRCRLSDRRLRKAGWHHE